MRGRQRVARHRSARPPADQVEVRRPELILGLVAAVGTPLDRVQTSLAAQVKRFGYQTEVLRLSEYANRFSLPTRAPAKSAGEAARIDAMMNRGNEARAKTGRADILALAAIADIRVKRGSDNRPLPGRAFVLRQLKRPEEVHLLRRTYGTGFILLGIFSPRAAREEHLKKLGASARDVNRLIARDEHEPSESGQQLRSTFHLADVFLEVGGTARMAFEDALDRALKLFFGVEIMTPTVDEFGMFQAFATALRSAQLARQVGAAVLSDRGDVLAVGVNEVPRPGGGLYWEGDAPDGRDHRRGRDSSDEAEEEIVREILERTRRDWLSLPAEKRRALEEDLRARLRGSRIASLTEFGRAVHAEAEAIVSATRMGISTAHATLYCTTFPCHVCAKHIVAAGIGRVLYIEPYPKSRVSTLYGDSISLEETEAGKVCFAPFVGVAPRRYVELFSMTTPEGTALRRKDVHGRVITGEQHLRLEMPYLSALQRESRAARELEALTVAGG